MSNPGLTRIPQPPRSITDPLVLAYLNQLVQTLETRNTKINSVLSGFTGTFTDGAAQTVTVLNGIIVSVS